eukprot:SAG31_NODE_7335_length_1716_cov_1.578850_1_plen_336_part_00
MNLQVGAYREARRTVVGRSATVTTAWLATPGRLDAEFVMPAFFLDKQRTATKHWRAFLTAYKLVEGEHFVFDESTKTATSPGNCVFFCTEHGRRPLSEAIMPPILLKPLSLSGAVRAHHQLVIQSDHGQQKTIVKIVTTKVMRRRSRDGRVLETPIRVKDLIPSGQRIWKDWCVPYYDSTNATAPRAPSSLRADEWRNELARLHSEFPNLPLFEEWSGSAAAGWPTELSQADVVTETVDDSDDAENPWSATAMVVEHSIAGEILRTIEAARAGGEIAATTERARPARARNLNWQGERDAERERLEAAGLASTQNWDSVDSFTASSASISSTALIA